MRSRIRLALILGAVVLLAAALGLRLAGERAASTRSSGAAVPPPAADAIGRQRALLPLRATLDSPAALKKPDRILFGVYDDGFNRNDMRALARLESAVRFTFPLIAFDVEWGGARAHQFPSAAVSAIDRLGSVPVITWQPALTSFDSRAHPHLPPREERDYASLAAIAKGEYDFYITAWAREAARFGKPFFLRFAHEMNDPYRRPWGPQNGNRPDDFIAAWRRIHGIFRKEGAGNAIWVWSPHIAMPWFEYYYPGDQVVDWVGLGVLNYGNVEPWSRWWTLRQIADTSYQSLQKFQKPLMVTEFATQDSGGDVVRWYDEAFADLAGRYDAVRAVIFFNHSGETVLAREPLRWSTTHGDERVSAFIGRELDDLSAGPAR